MWDRFKWVKMICKYVEKHQMLSTRAQVQDMLEAELPRVLSLLILSYLKEREIRVRRWGKSGNQPGEFNSPRGIASLPTGEIIVADGCNNRIQVFSQTGEFLRMWGKFGNGGGEFSYPCGVAVRSIPGASHEIFVADSGNARIQVFTPEGKFLRKWGKQGDKPGEFWHPCSITTLYTSDEIFVADTSNARIQVFTPEGKFLRMWGKQGEAPGMFYSPVSVISLRSGSSEEVVVLDTNQDRIQVFTPEGKFLRKWENKLGRYKYSHGITSYSPDEIIVVDTGNHRIHVFTSDGKFLRTWTNNGKKAGKFNHPFGIAALSSGEIVVTDTGNHRVQVFRTILD